jgi:hypothetical protein
VDKPVKPVSYLDVPDGINWLNKCVSQVMGEDPGINRFPVAAAYGEPKVLVAENTEGRRFLLSKINPDVIRHISTSGHWPWPFSHLNRFNSRTHPLVPLSRQVQIYELSTLKCGTDFIIEATHIWGRLTGDYLTSKELWLYVLPQPNR